MSFLTPALRIHLTALLGICLLACTESPGSYEERLLSARTQIAANDNMGAMIQLKSLVADQPDSAETREMLANVYLELGDTVSAIKEYEVAFRMSEPSLDSWKNYVKALVWDGQSERALEAIESRRDSTPDSEINTLLGLVHFREGTLDTADEHFQRALKAAPDNSDALLGAASLKLKRGAAEESAKLASKHLEVSPASWRGHLLLGAAHKAMGETEAATSACATAASLNPLNFGPVLCQLETLLAVGDIEAASATLKAAKRFAGAPLTTFYQAVIAVREDRLKAAEDHLRQVLSNVPNHPESQRLLAQVLYQDGRFEQADDQLSGYLAQRPDDAGAASLYAKILIKRRKAESALQVVEPMIGDGALPDPSLLEIYGDALWMTGSHDQGIESLVEASQLEPENQALQTKATIAQMSAGKIDEAVDGLLERIESGTGQSGHHVLLMFAYLQQHEWKKVIDVGEKVIGEGNSSPSVFNAMALAYVSMDKPDEARSLFEKSLEGDPDSVNVRQNLLLLHIEAGRIEEAAAQLAKLEAIAPDNAVSMTLAGRLAMEQGEIAKSVDLFERAREAEEALPEPRLRLGSYFLQTNQPARAIAPLNEAVKLRPNHFDTLILLSRALIMINQHAAADVFSARAMHLYPQSVAAVYLNGLSAHGTGDYDTAKKRFDSALERQPENVEVIVAAARNALRLGNRRNATTLVERLAAIPGTAAIRNEVAGDIAVDSGDFPNATKLYQEASKLNQDKSIALKLSKAQLAMEDHDGAISTLENFLDKNPADLRVTFELAVTKQLAGSTDEAVALYESLLSRAPNLSMALNNLGLIKHEQGDPRGIELLERAYELAPESSTIADSLGWALANSNASERALSLLEKAVAGNPNDAETRYHYAVVLAKGGQKASALQELAKALADEEFASREAALKLQAALSN